MMCDVKERHFVPPATAAQIRKAVGATREDIKVVNEVLRELGHPTIPLRLRRKPANGNVGHSSAPGRSGKVIPKTKQPRGKQSTAAR
jgi:hypothetical protein